MTAMQFDAEIREGLLALPLAVRGAFEGPVHVILVKEDGGAEDDLISKLLASPADVPGFLPLSRDEADGR